MYKKIITLALTTFLCTSAAYKLELDISSKLPHELAKVGEMFITNITQALGSQETHNDLQSFFSNISLATTPVKQDLKDGVLFLQSNIIKTTGSIAGIIVAGVVIKIIAEKYIKRYLFEPKLIEETNRGFLNRIKSFFKKKINIEDKMIINDSLKEDLTYIIQMTQNIQKNGGFYENILLYGEPGTGKTLFAKLLAEYCNMDYVIIPAANISQFLAQGKSVDELNQLFNSIKKPTIVFFDEIETFLTDRKQLSLEAQNALSIFLAKTGGPSKKIMIIGTTNRPEAIDEAAMSRFGLKVHFQLPSKFDRKQQLIMHIQELFKKEKTMKLQWEYLKNDACIDAIAKSMDGFSGRAIQQFVNKIYQIAMATNQFTIDGTIINLALDQCKKAQLKNMPV